MIGIGAHPGRQGRLGFCGHSFYNNLPKKQRKTPEIYFAGTNISGTYLTHLLELVGDRSFSVNVISKSGTTTEPAVAFRIFKENWKKNTAKRARGNVFMPRRIMRAAP